MDIARKQAFNYGNPAARALPAEIMRPPCIRSAAALCRNSRARPPKRVPHRLSFIHLCLIVFSGCGVSKTELDVERQQRAAAERKMDSAIVEANLQRSKREETERQAELMRGQLEMVKSERLDAVKMAIESQKLWEDGAKERTHLAGQLATLRTKYDDLKKRIDDEEGQRKKWRESAIDYTGLPAIKNLEAVENLRIRLNGVLIPNSIFTERTRELRDAEGRRAYWIVGGEGNTPFLLSEQLRDDLLKHGSSLGLTVNDKWDARLYFVVRREGSESGREPPPCRQLYRIELYKSPDLSGAPALVLEDEKVTEKSTMHDTEPSR